MRKASWWILTLVLVVGGVFLYHYHNTGKEDAEKPLTAEGFPIQDAHDMHEEGENLFVVSQKTLYRFNREGDFICQITQPDDLPVAGRRPRRLKSLFKNLVRQSQPAKQAPQVASAVDADRQTSGSVQDTAQSRVAAKFSGVAEPEKHQGQPTSSYSSANRPQLKSKNGSLGFSWNNLREYRASGILTGRP